MAVRPLKPIKKESVRVQVFRQLRDQVLRRTWAPGSKIPSEHELSRTMGVSRVSIREGIQHLVSLGILETRHGEGTFVRELSGELYFNSLIPLIALDETDIFHVLEYRRIIEKGTAALAAERATDHDLGEMEAVYDRMVRSRDDVAEFARADLEFHLVVAKATGNSVLIKVNNVLRSVLSVSMENIVSTLGMRDGLHYHRLLIEAVRSRNAPEAERLMEEHVVRTIERLRSEAGPAASGAAPARIPQPRAGTEDRLVLHRAFWNREEQPRPLASFRVGDFFFARHFKAAHSLLEPDTRITPEMLDVAAFLPDYARMFQESEAIGQDGFWTAEPFTGIPWMEAILGCAIRAGRESFTSRPWLSSPAEALEKVSFDPENPWLKKYLEFTAALVQQSRGRFPVGMPIMRGPTDMIGALLGQQEMVLALMMEDPAVMRRLIERLTRAFLSVIEAQRRLVPAFHGGTALGFYHVWAPGPSIWFQDDLSAILSPKVYREFFLGPARLILAGRPHTAFHLHPASFFIIDELLGLEGLRVIEVNKDIGGPSVKEMLPVLARIMQTRGLILWGDLTIEDLEVVKRNLPCRGLCLHVVAPTLAEAHERREYIHNWE
ncbi:MAG: FCD domain-containing protein [Deltaproteobacteria bacterium]|nr:FCD domain-containing protein [Deltaproteobacteria bacterium]